MEIVQSSASYLPDLSAGDGIRNYLRKIYSYPILQESEEKELFTRLQDHGCTHSAQKIVLAHLRLVAKIAFQYKKYGAALSDLISEGNLGLMHAVKKFRSDMGCRIATYAMWWIKAAMQNYILNSWSILKVSSAELKKKLFCGLKDTQSNLQKIENCRDDNKIGINEELTTDNSVNAISTVESNTVIENNLANARYTLSLDCDQSTHDEYGIGLSEVIADNDALNQETTVIEQEEHIRRKILLRLAVAQLNTREREIIYARRLNNTISTLGELAEIFNVSAERIRQIEKSAMNKMSTFIEAQKNVSINTLMVYLPTLNSDARQKLLVCLYNNLLFI